jgi:hypothetical protein
MKRAVFALLLGLAACASRPLLEKVPRPNPAVAAGIAVGLAAAATLADPQGAARQKEAGRVEPQPRVSGARESIPDDVFDRLEQADAK